MFLKVLRLKWVQESLQVSVMRTGGKGEWDLVNCKDNAWEFVKIMLSVSGCLPCPHMIWKLHSTTRKWYSLYFSAVELELFGAPVVRNNLYILDSLFLDLLVCLRWKNLLTAQRQYLKKFVKQLKTELQL